MGEINITIKIEDIEMNTDDKIGYLKDIKEYEVVDFLSLAERSDILPKEQLKQWRGDPQKSPEERREERQNVIRHYEEHSSELYKVFGENPEALKTEIFPNQVLYVVLTNTTSFSLETFGEKEIKRVIRGIIDKQLELNGKITKFGRGDSLFEGEEYYIELIVAEDKKEENKTICKGRSEILLLKEFWAQTEFGKVISFQIPHEVLDVFNKTSDFYVITSILGKASGYFYSADLGPDVEEHLLSEEYISLPQIDFSDYVNELIEIVRNPLFMEICEIQYINKVKDWLEEIKKGKYEAAPEGTVEHILRKIAYSVGVKGKGLQNFLDNLTKNDKTLRLFEETKCLIKALARNPRAHGRLERPKTDDKYFTILGMKAFRDIYLDWHFFESLNICFEEVEKRTGDSFEELWKEYIEDIKRKRDRYLFSWGNIPGKDSERLLRFLRDDLDIGWAENAEISKLDGGRTIHIFKDENSAKLEIDGKEGKTTLKISDDRNHVLKAKKDGEKLNIYGDRKRDEILDDYERKEDKITFKINFKDNKFSFVVDLSEKSIEEVWA